MDHESRIGCFGKMPAMGDFYRYNVRTAARSLDRWIQGGIFEARRIHGSQFCDIYRTAPPYRFLTCDPRSDQTIAGALDFSADQHCREFPLVAYTLVSGRPPHTTSGRTLASLQVFYHAVEAVVVQASRGLSTKQLIGALHNLEPDAQPRSAEADSFRKFLIETNMEARWSWELIQELRELISQMAATHTNTWRLGIRIFLPDDCAELEFEAAFWIALIFELSQRRMTKPTFLWTHGSGEAQRPNLLVFFKPPAVDMFPSLLDDQFEHQLLWPLGRGRSLPRGRITLPLSQLVRPASTLADVIYRVGSSSS